MRKYLEKIDVDKEETAFCGSVLMENSSVNLFHPFRFFPSQIEYLKTVSKEHRAIATSGISIKFSTNASIISFDTNVVYGFTNKDPAYTLVDRGQGNDDIKNNSIYDGIDLLVDGEYIRTYNPSLNHIEIHFKPEEKYLWRNVCIALPYIMSVNIGNFKCNGEFVPKPRSGTMLALGDSITQGFFAGCPSASYPERLAQGLGVDLINQAIAGYGFDKNTLCSLEELQDTVKIILIAYGTNDWSHKLSADSIASDAYDYLNEVARIFPTIPTFVVSPIWRADERKTVPSGKSFCWLAEMLSDACKAFPEMRFIDGYNIVPHDTIFFADRRLHPGANGAKLISGYLLSEIVKSLPSLKNY